MKLKVDASLCELHAQCVYVAPEIFRIEDDKLIYEPEVPPDLRAKAEKAVKVCPQMAIELED